MWLATASDNAILEIKFWTLLFYGFFFFTLRGKKNSMVSLWPYRSCTYPPTEWETPPSPFLPCLGFFNVTAKASILGFFFLSNQSPNLSLLLHFTHDSLQCIYPRRNQGQPFSLILSSKHLLLNKSLQIQNDRNLNLWFQILNQPKFWSFNKIREFGSKPKCWNPFQSSIPTLP